MSTLTTYKHDEAQCHNIRDAQTDTIKQLKNVLKELEHDDCQRPYRGQKGCKRTQRYAPMEKAKIPAIVYPNYPPKPSFKYGAYEPSKEVAPWVFPRYPSFELIGGNWHRDCECHKRNGLQDDCHRTWCRGRPVCREDPPLCPPSGIWKKCVDAQEADRIRRVYTEKERHLRANMCQRGSVCKSECPECLGPLTKDMLMKAPARAAGGNAEACGEAGQQFYFLTPA